jgi:Protein of unknown function (DUF1697)
MITYIALLRAINVGGHRRVAMPKLRDFVSSLGFTNAQTLLRRVSSCPRERRPVEKMVVSSHPPWYLAFE